MLEIEVGLTVGGGESYDSGGGFIKPAFISERAPQSLSLILNPVSQKKEQNKKKSLQNSN